MSDPVTDGREALQPWFGYPWYDAPNDGVRRVEVSSSRGPLVDLSGPLLQWAAWTLIGVLLATAAGLLILAYVRRERTSSSDKEDATAGDAERIEALPELPSGGIEDLLGEARRCYEQGDYRAAMIYLFSHQLVRLDKRQIIHLARGKTNQQYLREVGRRSPLGELLEQTVTVFEEVYFGHHTINRARFQSCWLRLDEFEGLTEQGRSSG